MLTCYPQPGKARSREVLEALAAGWPGARLAEQPVLAPGPAAFYGAVGLESLLREATRTPRWYYGDNAFFDRSRGRFFRFAANEFQLSFGEPVAPDYARLAALGVQIQPWRKDGRHIVVVEQSEHFLGLVGAGPWLERTTSALAGATDRPLRIRRWRRDKDKAAVGLAADLVGAWALVTHMSGAAVEAALQGVPVFCTGPCAGSAVGLADLAKIETPAYPEHRRAWAAGLAARQWTLAELRNGAAFRALNAPPAC